MARKNPKHSEVIDLTLSKSSVMPMNIDDEDITVESASPPPIIDLCSTSSDEGPELNHYNLRKTTIDIRKRTRDVAYVHQFQNNTLKIRKLSGHSVALNCAICLDSCLKRNPTSTQCGHIFCEKCIKQSLRINGKCPICSTKLNNSQIFRLYVSID